MSIDLISLVSSYKPPPLILLLNLNSFAAGGAVFIAAVGVWAVFKMAFWVAGETGRSLKAEESKAQVANAVAEASSKADPDAAQSKAPRISSPYEQSGVAVLWEGRQRDSQHRRPKSISIAL